MLWYSGARKSGLPATGCILRPRNTRPKKRLYEELTGPWSALSTLRYSKYALTLGPRISAHSLMSAHYFGPRLSLVGP